MEHMLNSNCGSVQPEEEFFQACIQDYVVDLKAQVEKRGDDFRVYLSGSGIATFMLKKLK